MLAVTATPVIVRSAPPEVIKSIPPVNVAHLPGPDLVAWATLGVAIVTLAAVGYQIWVSRKALELAQKELKATNETLDLAKDELAATKDTLDVTRASNDLVQESLRYAREQSDYLSQRATLWLFCDNTVTGVGPSVRNPSFNVRQIRFYVANYLTAQKGRAAHGASVTLLVPPGLGVTFGGDGSNEAIFAASRCDWRNIGRFDRDDVHWVRWEGTLSQTCYPGNFQLAFGLNVHHSGNVERPIMWSLSYEDGLTPTDGQFLPLQTIPDADRSRLAADVLPKLT